tara:strand:- start:194 stop:349 length:156 start_codon:yes stop_codon:yes gene_type:complete
MIKPATPQEITERAILIEKMYHLDKRRNGLLNGLGKELETYLKWKNLFTNE